MKKGFTLAEVLITLGVIGVVAALTMPNLLQNHQKKVFVTQLQRTVNLISNAATQLMADSNATSLNDTYLVAIQEKKETSSGREYSEYTGDSFKNAQGRFLNQYFKVARDCGTSNPDGCLAEEYYTLDRTYSGHLFGSSHEYCVTINTGATICMVPMGYEWGGEDMSSAALIYVDVNGKSGPNTDGRDLFTLMLYSNGDVKSHFPTKDQDDAIKDCGQRLGSYGCMDRIMAEGWVMDY